jgi:hypothetical protein
LFFPTKKADLGEARPFTGTVILEFSALLRRNWATQSPR